MLDSSLDDPSPSNEVNEDVGMGWGVGERKDAFSAPTP